MISERPENVLAEADAHYRCAEDCRARYPLSYWDISEADEWDEKGAFLQGTAYGIMFRHAERGR
jgi:hypothetical protein